MSSSDLSDHDVIDPLADDPLAFLYEPGDEDEENPPELHAGYGSLMGVGVRKAPKTGKAMAIMLDEVEANRAAEVMEINAGQLMTNPDRSSRHIGFLGLDPLDAAEEEVEEDALAESLTWEAAAEEDEDADWQPENPLAGTGLEEEEDDADWRPENPLAGTEFVQSDEDVDWQPVNPPAGIEFAERADWDVPDALPVEQPAPGPASYAQEAYAWPEPAPLAEQPAEPALEDEHAWSANTPVAEEPQFEEVEWEVPLATTEVSEAPATEEVAAIDAPEEVAELPYLEEPELAPELADADELAAEPAEASPTDWYFVPDASLPLDPAEPAPTDWQAMMGKKRTKEPALPPPTEWDEFPTEEAPAEYVAAEPVLPAHEDWPASDEQFVATETSEMAEPEWQTFAADEPDEIALPPEVDLPEFAAEEAAGPYGSEWSAFFKEGTNDRGEVLPAEPEQIEIVRFAAPPPVEVTHHSLRARVMQSHQARVAQPSLTATVLKWLGEQFRQVALPLLKKLWVWSRAKWQEIAARPPRD